MSASQGDAFMPNAWIPVACGILSWFGKEVPSPSLSRHAPACGMPGPQGRTWACVCSPSQLQAVLSPWLLPKTDSFPLDKLLELVKEIAARSWRNHHLETPISFTPVKETLPVTGSDADLWGHQTGEMCPTTSQLSLASPSGSLSR